MVNPSNGSPFPTYHNSLTRRVAMKARSLSGQEIDISANTLDTLKTFLQGQVIVPGENGYQESKTIWNGMINRRPAFVVRCLGVADVIASVKFAREHDLLLCIRGGGNFGIVTGIDYKLYPVGPEIVGGPVASPASEAASVLELYRKLIKEAPPELTLVIIMRPAPPAPWLPADMHGKPIIVMLACYSGDPEQGEKAVAPIKSFGKPIGDVLIRRPYAQLQSLLDATQPNGRRYYWKSEYLPDIESALCEKLVEYAAKIPSPHSAAILFQLDGALNQLSNDHSAVGNRDARYVVNLASSWENSGDDDVNIGWARAAWADMKQFSTGGTYVNFLTEDEGPERIEAALSSSYQRLTEIKKKWDPQNVFRTNRNISPA